MGKLREKLIVGSIFIAMTWLEFLLIGMFIAALFIEPIVVKILLGTITLLILILFTINLYIGLIKAMK